MLDCLFACFRCLLFWVVCLLLLCSCSLSCIFMHTYTGRRSPGSSLFTSGFILEVGVGSVYISSPPYLALAGLGFVVVVVVSKCPLLKTLGLYSNCSTIAYSDKSDSSIADLFECIPMIENLSICFHIISCFVKDTVPKKLPIALIHLKYLVMETLSFMHKYGLPFLALLIRSSPKLEKLKLEFIDENTLLEEHEMGPIAIEDYSDIWLEHLNKLELIDFGNREYELDFVKLILAKSPMLKKVRIFLYKKVDEDEGLKIKEILLRSSRASPAVEIIVQGTETIRAWCFLTVVSEMSNHVSS